MVAAPIPSAKERTMKRIRIAISARAALVMAAAALTLTAFAGLIPSGVMQGVDVKVTHDNNNVDVGTADPGFDGRNLEQQEPTVAISPLDPSIVVVASNDQR